VVLHARVKAGRYVIDEPADLPEGSIVELVPIDDTMDAEERAALEAAIAEGIEDADRGNTIDAREFLERLRAKP
jgi:hypothetical protein